MKSVKFDDSNIEIAKNQEEYQTVYADVRDEPNYGCKVITICYELSPEEIQNIAQTGKIWYQQLGVPMSPMSIHVNNPLK